MLWENIKQIAEFDLIRKFISLLLVLFLISAFSCAYEQPPTQGLKSETVWTLPEQIATIAADRQIFQVMPETVRQHLSGIVEIKAEEPNEFVWEFKGVNAKSGMRWAHVQFQPGEPGSGRKWQLLQIILGVMPLDGDYNGLYNALCTELSKRLGMPSKSASGTATKRRIWSVAPYWEIWVNEGTYDNPLEKQVEHVILIEIAVLQGEAE